GAYRPLAATGPAARHLVAFARGDAVVTVVPRLARAVGERGGWEGTAVPLPAGRWHSALTDGEWRGRVAVAEMWNAFPVALLVRAEGGEP
ncbi:MAG: malto-oligosyltrehalose synthase, partial [Gemmatimonadales bacterium]